MNSQQIHPIYEFGEFRLEPARRVLSSRIGGQPLQVTSKVFDVLLYMVEHPAQLLEKRALFDALWPNVVVEEGSLTHAIHTLRRLLGEKPDDHRFIVTVPGRGYRFIAEVRMLAAAADETSDPAPAAPAPVAPAGRWQLLTLMAVSFAALGFLAWLLLGSPGKTPHAPASVPAPAIAVLPFVDMSPGHDLEYFGDGLSEEILNQLAQSALLRVIARTSSFSFKEQRADIATIAVKLNVTHVLEGSVRRSGERIRVTAQLVDGATGAHLWSQTYDRDVQDVFGVQQDIAASIVESLHVTLTGDPLEASGLRARERRAKRASDANPAA